MVSGGRTSGGGSTRTHAGVMTKLISSTIRWRYLSLLRDGIDMLMVLGLASALSVREVDEVRP